MVVPAEEAVMKPKTAKQKKFEDQLDAFVDRVEAQVWFTKIIAARFVVDKLVQFSPIWSGAYIKSHRLGIGRKDRSHEPYITVEGFESMMARRLTPSAMIRVIEYVTDKLKDQAFDIKKNTDYVHITNSIPYGDQVEYLGWSGWSKEGGQVAMDSTRAYHTYAKARLALIANKKGILAKAKTNVEKVKSGKYTARQAD